MIFVNARAIIERNNNNKIEIVVQKRMKKGQEYYELPGGQLNEYESLIDALKREVVEETGLKITKIINDENVKNIKYTGKSFDVECLKPYAVYQTLRGPVDSMGVYFRCNAEGELLQAGDDTADIQWMDVDELKEFVQEENKFSDIDKSAVLFYIENTYIHSK